MHAISNVRIISSLVFLGGLNVACSSGAAESERAATSASSDTLEVDGRTFDRFDGSLREWGERHLPQLTEHLRETAKAPDMAPARRLDSFSKEELAQAGRRVRLHHDGMLYMERAPNDRFAELASAVWEAPRVADLVRRPRERAGELEGTVGDQRQSLVIGPDGRRTPAFGTTFAPFNSIVNLGTASASNRGRCTGFYIGPWTILTSAHCLLFPDGSRATWLHIVRGQQGESKPYGEAFCDNADGDPNNNLTWTVPAGYSAVWDVNNPWDFAVIDTWPCTGSPDHYGGYAINADDASFWHFGYPGWPEICPDAPGGDIYMRIPPIVITRSAAS